MTGVNELTTKDLAELAFDAGMFYRQTSLLPDGNETKNPDFEAWWPEIERTKTVRLNPSGEVTPKDVAWAAFQAGVSYWQTHILADGNPTKAPDFDPWWAEVERTGEIQKNPAEAHIWEHPDFL